MFFLGSPNTKEKYKLKMKGHVLVKIKLKIVKDVLYFNNDKMHIFHIFEMGMHLIID